MTVVTHFWSAPVGIHVCLRLHTNLDPSSYNTFAAVLNYLSYIVLKTPPFSMQCRVASIYCALVTPIPRFWCSCASLNLPETLRCLPETLRCLNISRVPRQTTMRGVVAFPTYAQSDVSPTLAMAQILPLTNPSTSVGGASTHWHSSWDSKPCWPCRHSFILIISSSCSLVAF